jgi:hypothetical protein
MGEKAVRVRSEYSMEINAPAESIFPLLCPVEELKWIDGWTFDMVHSDSGVNEKFCVFAERMSAAHLTGFDQPGPTCWITTAYDRAGRAVQFVLVQAFTLTTMEVSVSGKGGRSRVTFSMTMTALDEKGAALLGRSAPAGMNLMMEFLGRSLKHYCEQGAMLRTGS